MHYLSLYDATYEAKQKEMKESYLLDTSVLIRYENKDELATKQIRTLIDSKSELYILDITLNELNRKMNTTLMSFIEKYFHTIVSLKPFAVSRPSKDQYWLWDELYLGDERMDVITDAFDKVASHVFTDNSDGEGPVSNFKNDADIIINTLYRNFTLITYDKKMAGIYTKLVKELEDIDLPDAPTEIEHIL